MNGRRVKMYCRDIPSKFDCSLSFVGTEKEVMAVVLHHTVHAHGHRDTPQLREQIRMALTTVPPEEAMPPDALVAQD